MSNLLPISHYFALIPHHLKFFLLFSYTDRKSSPQCAQSAEALKAWLKFLKIIPKITEEKSYKSVYANTG